MTARTRAKARALTRRAPARQPIRPIVHRPVCRYLRFRCPEIVHRVVGPSLPRAATHRAAVGSSRPWPRLSPGVDWGVDYPAAGRGIRLVVGPEQLWTAC